MKISICIPTYNRADNLVNCLQSIILNQGKSEVDFEVCVSDNCSTDHTKQVVREAQSAVSINYKKNSENVGRVRNYLNVVDMAEGEFVWFLGDDDLLLPNALEKIAELIDVHKSVDFFYINSFHLTADYVASCPQPFDTSNLPKDMMPFSEWPKSEEMAFMDLIDPKISFDFLGGFFLAVFRRRNWLQHVNQLDENAISDLREFSHFDNTFPHVKIFAKAFALSYAYFHAKPLSVCLTGAREWAPMYPFVRSVRLVEALYEYRRNGLPYLQYLRCKNYALSNFIPDFVSMLINKHESGFIYTNPLKLVLGNCLYPNFYLSPLYYVIRKYKLFMDKNYDLPAKTGAGFNKETQL